MISYNLKLVNMKNESPKTFKVKGLSNILDCYSQFKRV